MSVAVVGAGAAGLATARNLLAAGFEVEVLERDTEIGGVWNYGRPQGRVYRSTTMISSKPFTQFPDFPMPPEFPDYPHHTQVLRYLRAYADHFDLVRHVRFGREVVRIEPETPTSPASRWRVSTADGATTVHEAVVIANGHNWAPRRPRHPGHFDGVVFHSAEYRTPERFEGRRVLVVGAGNSGCDIAVEAAGVARATFLSMRRGYHYVPKYLFGRPVDQVNDALLRLRVPLPVRRALASLAVRLGPGSPQRVGLPTPDHRLFETHPIVNSRLPEQVRRGRIVPVPDVAALEGDRVRFVGGRTEPIDVIVYATGYRVAFPFVERELLAWRDGAPDLLLHVFHPAFDTLFVAGMIQTDSGVFALVHWQTRAIARALRTPEFRDALARVRLPRAPAIHYQATPRHRLEVEHHSYARTLRRAVSALGG